MAGTRGPCQTPPTSLSLLGRMRNDVPGAWREFDLFHRDLILHWARRFGCSPEAAEDVCQETLVALFRALPAFEHNGRRGGFHAFLKTLVQRRSADALRRLGRVVTGLDSDMGRGEHAAPAAGTVRDGSEDALWVRMLVRRACARVFESIDSLTYRSFRLYVIDGVSVDETARRVGLERPATVYQQKSRVLKAIRDAMREILSELDDPELRTGASRLRGDEAIRIIAALIAEDPEVRVTERVSPTALNRIAVAREALELCRVRRDGPWLVVARTTRVVSLEARECATIGSRDADVLVEAAGVSGRHCTIRRRPGGWIAVDEGSRNGLRVNGQRVAESELCDGDVLTLAGEHLVFLQASDEDPAPAQA